MKFKIKSMLIVCLLLITMTFAAVPASAATATTAGLIGNDTWTTDSKLHFFKSSHFNAYGWYNNMPEQWGWDSVTSYAVFEDGVLHLYDFQYKGDCLNDKAYGIYADGDLEIRLHGRSSIDVSSTANTTGIQVAGKLTITADTDAGLTIKAAKDGIVCDNLEFVSGNLTVTAGNDGIVTNTATFKGGSLGLTSEEVGIKSAGKVAIEGCSVSVTGAGGIKASGNVVMTDGSWTIFSHADGIVCSGGDVSINGGAINIYAAYDGIDCSNGIYINGGGMIVWSEDATSTDTKYYALKGSTVKINTDCKVLAASTFYTMPENMSAYVASNNNTYDRVDVLRHVWGTGEVTTAATCETEGVRTYTCANCGKTKPETIAKLGHKYSTSYTVDKKATTTANGSKSKHCTRSGCTSKTSVKTIYKASGVKLAIAAYTYNGKTKSPSVVIKDSKGNTISSSNYTLTKPSGRKNVGKYIYKIKFKNAYSGTKSLTLKINPKGTSLASLTKGSKAITVKWKKQSAKMSESRITGYEVRYSTSSKMSSAKKVPVKGYSKVSKKITGLKSGKTYYVQVRTYKTVDGIKYYSDWSAKKSVKTK